MCDVARRNGVKAQQLSVWRSRARRGELALPGSQAPAFVTVEVEPERDSGPVAIEAFGVTIHLERGSSAARIAEVVSALRSVR